MKSLAYLLFALMVITLDLTVFAVEAVPYEKLPLWPDPVPGALGEEPADRPDLWLFLTKPAEPSAAVVIVPGGGYARRAVDHEGIQVAQWLNTLGIQAVVCNYRVRGEGAGGKGYGHPVPMLDAQRAIRILRARAGEWNIDPDRVGILGFSAGGHLASTVSTHFDGGDKSSADPVNRFSCRPDFAVLCYPVIAFDKPHTHRGSQKNLLGENPDPLLVASLSNEAQVTKDTPPTFLFHTAEDQAVPVENSLEYFLALKRQGVPAELHVFERGKHGLGLAKQTEATNAWPELCAAWLRVRGIAKSAGVPALAGQ